MAKKLLYIFSFFAVVILFFAIVLFFLVILKPYPLENKKILDVYSFSQVVKASNNDILRITLTTDEKYRIKGTLNSIPPLVIESVLFYEDKYFYSHFGVNPFSLLRGFYQTYIAQNRKIGASTLTMQVVRLRFNLNTSSLAGKIEQMFLALQMEWYHSKDEILEAYFNLAPYGGNIEGIFAAARIYFEKEPQRLTLSESIALASIPQNPVKRNPWTGKDFTLMRSQFEAKWQEKYPDYNLAMVPLKISPAQNIPFLAPHFTLQALKLSSAPHIETSLKLGIQGFMEDSLKRFVARGEMYGIKNAAALLIHSSTMEIQGYVGSADFYNSQIEGQVDGLLSYRSPGSTLKPFIYALAQEQGIIHEKTLLLDSPRSFQGYNPKNFDKEYMGPLPADQALYLSRNIPAISLAAKLKYPDLYDFLLNTGLKLPYSKEHYGLSLVLGGAEIRPIDLAKLYAMLLNQGMLQEPTFLKNSPASLPKKILSKEVTYITLKMLESPEHTLSLPSQKLPLRLKTGTSNGLRDAWAVGTVGEYVLLIWIGNFNNASNPHFIGGDLAVPLFMDIAYGLSRQTQLHDPLEKDKEDLNIIKIPVCTETGDINIALCPQSSQSLIHYIPGTSPIRDTGILKPILIDTRTNFRVCSKTIENAPFVKEDIAYFWPNDMYNFYLEAGIEKSAPPPFDPSELNNPFCKIEYNLNSAPIIISPKNSITYHLNPTSPTPIPLQAQVYGDSAFVYWFAGQNYLGRTRSKEPLLYYPTTSQTEIIAADTMGRSSKEILLVQ